MALKNAQKTENRDPAEVVHLQVKPGETVTYQGRAYGDRATLQVPRGNLGQVHGRFDEIDPSEVPDAGDLPDAA